jgi:hypothetical protein
MNGTPIIIPHRITRKFIQAHPAWIFLYSDDLLATTYRGQSNAAAGEPNCFMVPVKIKCCDTYPQAYFQDNLFDLIYKETIDKYLRLIPVDSRSIVPFPKIGEGSISGPMRSVAPKCWQYLKSKLDSIKYNNITIDYKI